MPDKTPTPDRAGISIGIPDAKRLKVIELLNTLLADEVLLYLKARNFHWNVQGMQFGQLHKFFEDIYEQLDETMDDVAERARALDGKAAGSAGEMLKLSRLKESPDTLDAIEMLRTLLADTEAVIKSLREDSEKAADLGDAGTEDFMVGIMEAHEKMAWMIRAHLR
ncbi:Dps family protein [Derxia gummosa]|uniref:Dps family protein n=1 Tax=Derxia gummosa DSM 723 TaxID=1121388 RepID=A0A8B6X7D4_9BURK|nr:DNA starvation/stationary phase protection protein [Derxia gummosa]